MAPRAWRWGMPSRMKPGEVAALRKKPGPIPAGWTACPSDRRRRRAIARTADSWRRALRHSPGTISRRGARAAASWVSPDLAVATRFMAEGVWGTSPHLIPHFALHSASGSISLALGSHGEPCRVGGGLHAVAEGILAGADVAVDRRGAGCVAPSGIGRQNWCPILLAIRPTLENAGPLLALVGIGDGAGGSPALRVVFGSAAEPAILRAIWHCLPEQLNRSGERIRPDDRDDQRPAPRRVRREGQRLSRDEAIWKYLSLSGLRASGRQRRWAMSSRILSQPAGRAVRCINAADAVSHRRYRAASPPWLNFTPQVATDFATDQPLDQPATCCCIGRLASTPIFGAMRGVDVLGGAEWMRTGGR